jgi:hypothetical protein
MSTLSQIMRARISPDTVTSDTGAGMSAVGVMAMV